VNAFDGRIIEAPGGERKAGKCCFTGTWLPDALVLRDRWQNRLLRTVRWSPLA
jgi:hypothetical protein